MHTDEEYLDSLRVNRYSTDAELIELQDLYNKYVDATRAYIEYKQHLVDKAKSTELSSTWSNTTKFIQCSSRESSGTKT